MDLTVAEVEHVLATCAGGLVEPLPWLDDDQRARLVAGDVVRIVNRDADPDAPSSAVGLAVFHAARAAVWVAVQDPHATVDPALTEFVIEQKGPDHAIWYGYLDLPRPIHDRQWVVESTNNRPLATTAGCWEHNWRLVPDGLDAARRFLAEGGSTAVTAAQLDQAIYTPVNHGHWLLVPLPGDRTLVAYQATSVIGGSIPDWLVLQLAMSRLESVLRSAEARAREWAPGHYRGDHPPLLGADGAALPGLP